MLAFTPFQQSCWTVRKQQSPVDVEELLFYEDEIYLSLHTLSSRQPQRSRNRARPKVFLSRYSHQSQCPPLSVHSQTRSCWVVHHSCSVRFLIPVLRSMKVFPVPFLFFSQPKEVSYHTVLHLTVFCFHRHAH